MSDIFDHGLDAFESRDRSYEYSQEQKYKSNYDPLAYHMKISTKIVKEIGASTVLIYKGLEVQIPTSWIRKHKSSIYVWSKGFINKLRKIQIQLKAERDRL
jgi:hypothetical protein